VIKLMNTVQTVPVQVETHGRVPDGMRELAAAKASSLFRFASEPILSARVTLAVSADPALPRPAVAQATIDLNGRTIRARAVGETMRAAIDHMSARLRVRLDRSARDWAARRGTLPVPEPGEWRHQSIPAHRTGYFPRPTADRTVIRRLSYAPHPLTPEEAVAELDLLDYDFHLFTERSTGEDSVLYRVGDRYRLAQARPKPDRLGPLPAAITLSEHWAPVLTLAEAIGRLEWLGQPFVFFVNPETGGASLVYHRYDGHYGLVSPENLATVQARSRPGSPRAARKPAPVAVGHQAAHAGHRRRRRPDHPAGQSPGHRYADAAGDAARHEGRRPPGPAGQRRAGRTGDHQLPAGRRSPGCGGPRHVTPLRPAREVPQRVCRWGYQRGGYILAADRRDDDRDTARAAG